MVSPRSVDGVGSSPQDSEGEQKGNGSWFTRRLLPALNGKSNHQDSPENGGSEQATSRRDGRAGISASVSLVFETKLDILREAIGEIDSGLRAREKLNRTFEGQIDAEISECLDLLSKLPYPWSEGFQPKMEFLRVSLHKSFLTRRKDKRSEQLSYWDDVTSLLEKKRTLLMECQSLLATRKAIEDR